MIDAEKGKIVCDNGFVISRFTRLNRFLKNMEAYMISTEEINHYTHICLRNANASDDIYDLCLCFDPHKRLVCVDIIPTGRYHIPLRITKGKYVFYDISCLVSHSDEIKEDTRRWLNRYQSEDSKKYFWGVMGIAIDLDRSYCIHAFMRFR